jgi:hypothetical protein
MAGSPWRKKLNKTHIHRFLRGNKIPLEKDVNGVVVSQEEKKINFLNSFISNQNYSDSIS